MATFKNKTSWSHLEEAIFKTQKPTAEFGLNITDPTRIQIPKLADIPGMAGHNLIEATRTQIVAHLQNAYVNKMAFCIWGDTGVSKSATVSDFFEEIHAAKWANRKPIRINGLSRPKGGELKSSSEGVVLSDKSDVYINPDKYFFLADVRVSLLEEIDLKGVPNVEADTNIQTSYTPPLIHLISQPGAAGIVFFDEVNRTNNTGVKSALLSVFDKKDKRLGDAVLSENVFPVAAANIGFGFTDVAAIDAALKNRGGAAYLNLTVQEWLKYAKRSTSKTVTVATNVAKVAPSLPSTPIAASETTIHPAVVAFIESLPPESLFKGKPPASASEEMFTNLLKYPTYRGYELLSDGLQAAIERYNAGELTSHEQVLNEAIMQAGATCGYAFSEEFGKYMRSAATALDLDKIVSMDMSKSANLQTTALACKTNLLAYADAFFNDGDKASEKQLKGWSLVTLKLPPETQNAIWTQIKGTISNTNDKSVKDLPGKLAAFMLAELNDAKASGRVDQDTYDRIISALRAVAGLAAKPI